jgi:hypothetical protein
MIHIHDAYGLTALQTGPSLSGACVRRVLARGGLAESSDKGA